MLCVGDIFPTSPFPTTSGITKPLPVKEGYVNVVYMFPLKLSAKMEPEQEQILDNRHAFRPFPLINLIILSNGGISTRQNNHRTFDETEIYFCSKEHHQNIFNCGVDSAGNPIRTIFILGDRGQIKKIFTSAISCRCYFYDQKCCLAGSCSMNCLIAENIQETATPLFHQNETYLSVQKCCFDGCAKTCQNPEVTTDCFNAKIASESIKQAGDNNVFEPK